MVRWLLAGLPSVDGMPSSFASSFCSPVICSLIEAARFSCSGVRSSKFMLAVNIEGRLKSSGPCCYFCPARQISAWLIEPLGSVKVGEKNRFNCHDHEPGIPKPPILRAWVRYGAKDCRQRSQSFEQNLMKPWSIAVASRDYRTGRGGGFYLG